MNEILIKIGFTESDAKELSQCITPVTKTFDKGEIISDMSDNVNDIGFIVNGTAYFVSSTFEGQKNIIDIFTDNGVFGKPFSPEISGNGYYILAKTRCTVAFIPYEKLLNCCHKQCSRHMKIMEYVVNSYAKSTQIHIDILNKRTIRDKLCCYLRYLSIQTNSRQVTIPVPFTDLADYLAVDRSSMMRELKKMNDDNLIHTNNKKILLINIGILQKNLSLSDM